MKNNVFFDEGGITTTHANYLSNIAKEAYMSLQKEVDNVRFYKTTLNLIGTSSTQTLHEGVENIEAIPDKLKQIAKYKSLIAWFREAIKEKMKCVEAAKKSTDTTICELLGITIPNYPVRQEYPTQEELISKWNIKQRNRYYWLDTLCSTFGKYIHPDGTFAIERQNLADVLQKPHRVEGSGRDSIVYSFEPTMNLEDVNNMYFSLQDQYRGFQSELNSMKYQIEQELNESIQKIDSEFNLSMKQYNSAMRDIDSTVNKYRNELVQQANKLKIAIPDDLKEVYNTVNSMGKSNSIK